MIAVGMALLLAVDHSPPTVGAVLDRYGVKFADVQWDDEPVGVPVGIWFTTPVDGNGNQTWGLIAFKGRFAPGPNNSRPEARLRAMRVYEMKIVSGPALP